MSNIFASIKPANVRKESFSVFLSCVALMVAFLSVCRMDVYGQNVIYTDNFNSNTSDSWVTSGAIGITAWNVIRSGTDWGARRSTSNRLELTNNAGGGGNNSGYVFSRMDMRYFLYPYNSQTNTLNSNCGIISWSFNMRSPLADGNLEGCSDQSGAWSYGVAFILAGTSGFDNNSGNGYAVVLGQIGSTDYVRLVRIDAGMGSTTNIITGNTDLGTEYLSIKVTYNPTNNLWELFVRNDGSSGFTDPETGTLTSQGTATNNTYTGTSVVYMGAYWQGATNNNTAYFDNIKLSIIQGGPSITCPSDINQNASAGFCGANVSYSMPTWTDDCSQYSLSGFGAVMYNSTNGHYYALSTGSATWSNAEAVCRNNGGHLATVSNAAENSYLLSMNGGNSVWIGFTDQLIEGTANFAWCTDESVTYTNWNGGEPNNWGGGEDYTELTTGGGWNDLNSTTTRRYIIELGVSVVQTAGLSVGSFFPVGTTTNTFVVTDYAGYTNTCSFDVTINSTFNPGSINTAGQEICSNVDPSVIGSVSNASGGDGNYTYRWQSSTDAAFTSPVTINSNTATYDPPPGLTVTTYYRRQVHDGCDLTFITSAGVWQVTVYNLSTPPTAITGTAAVCPGGSTTLTSSGGTLGTDAKDVWYEGNCATEGFNQEWTTQPYTTIWCTVNSVSNGILTVTSNTNDPMIDMTNVGSFPAASYGYIHIRYRVVSGTAGKVEIYYSKTGGTDLSEAQCVRADLLSDNAWHTVSVPMSSSANWTNTITGWRYDWCTPATSDPADMVTMELDFIALADQPILGWGNSLTVSPTVNTTYFTRKKGLCNNTDCVSGEVTINALPTVSLAKTDIRCFSAGDGTITITASGGSLPYQYRVKKDAGAFGLWKAFTDDDDDDIEVISGLSPGEYTFEVMDGNGCIQVDCP